VCWNLPEDVGDIAKHAEAHLIDKLDPDMEEQIHLAEDISSTEIISALCELTAEIQARQLQGLGYCFWTPRV
jgi:hypothetical protein